MAIFICYHILGIKLIPLLLDIKLVDIGTKHATSAFWAMFM